MQQFTSSALSSLAVNNSDENDGNQSSDLSLSDGGDESDIGSNFTENDEELDENEADELNPPHGDDDLLSVLRNLSVEKLYPGSSLSCLEAFVLVQQFALHSNLSKTSFTDLLLLLRAMLPGDDLQLSSNLRAFLKVI
jgi:hypothetical protein